MSKRIYSHGPAISTLGDLIAWLDSGGWVYLPNNPRPKHPSVMSNMALSVLRGLVRSGRLHRAVKEPS
jgi:hypothetical protein